MTMPGILDLVFIALGEGIQFDRLLFEENRQELKFLMAFFTSGTNAAATLRGLIPVFSTLGITSIRPASSPQRDTGVSPDSLTTNSMSRRIVGWSSMKY
jgi:hypothetical protein